LDDGATLGTYNPDPGRGIGAGGGTGFLPIPILLAPKVSAVFAPVPVPVGTFDDIERIDEAAVLLVPVVPVAIVPLELDVALLLRLALPVDSRIESDAVEPDPTVNAEPEPEPTVDTVADADPTNAGLFTANPFPVLSLLVLVGIGVGVDIDAGTGTDMPTGTGGGNSCPPPSPCPYPSLDTDPLLEVCDGRRLTSLCGFGVGLVFRFGVGVCFVVRVWAG